MMFGLTTVQMYLMFAGAVVYACALTFLLPILFKRSSQAFQAHPFHKDWLENIRFYRKFTITVLIFTLLWTSLFLKELGVLSFFVIMFLVTYANLYSMLRYGSVKNDYNKALEAAYKHHRIIGWWIGKGRSEFVYQNWRVDEKVVFPRRRGYLFFSGMAVRHIPVLGCNGRKLETKAALWAFASMEPSSFDAGVSQAEVDIKTELQRFLDTGKGIRDIRSKLHFYELFGINGVQVKFSEKDTKLHTIEPVFA
ncbi:MAG: hypothetical protein US94_C0029G0010 [Berkelbacteria bacterium GW2011_GWB1_38_5]|uniref:Uncharacterized protein n=1 Tax=Berkelbacteria bacterium GW2011_GWB1_38_5 TaxID=1618336 RepID=A0A0G0KDW6_9BACT|nr:MAG: hypothetical protein US94_C0029G0010 [Berkelbacteria bacterium GW2011_GWB1_38_5]